MTNWRTMPTDQAANLATRLHGLDWSWTLDDAPTIIEQFGWRTVSSRPRRIMLDIGFGPGSGTIQAKNGEVTRIELQLTDYADEKPEMKATFTGLAQAIGEKLGEPTARVNAPTLQYRWAGTDSTVVLILSAASIWLHLDTNARLAADDRNLELDNQGLL
ncbi:DUF6301 family protein [Nocardia asteroides]|uniref:DUF6301 family protein n=1 Tax=Nocardia asteroides TaxID=1824 RepID=UPI001E321945|nr:DUF6301 family protein [Nocardia asteroides]UGT53468.1 DUF6301 family protein [Nocardia asteroides]